MTLVAALAAAATLANPAAPPPGALRCSPAVHHVPCARGMRLHTRYRFDLETACGIVDAWFDGRLWVATPMRSDGSGKPPRGWRDPWQRGTIALTTRERAVFRARKLVAHFRPAPSTYVPPDCSAPIVGPPPAFVVTPAGTTVALARGSYCWADAPSALCVDMLPPEQRTDIPYLEVQAEETLTFRLGFVPSEGSVTLFGRDYEPLVYTALPDEQAINWDVPPNLLTPSGALAVLAFETADGDASYLLWLQS